MSRRNIQSQESFHQQNTRQQLSVLDLQNQSTTFNQNRVQPENYKPVAQPQNVAKSQSKQQNQFQGSQSPPSSKRSKAQFHEDKTQPSWDIFCYGLCILELITLEQQDFNMQQPYLYLDTLEKVQDQQSREFILKCFEDAKTRPTAEQLLCNPYLKLPIQSSLSSRSFRSDHGRPTSPSQSSNHQVQSGNSPYPNSQQKGQSQSHNQNLESMSETQNSFSKIGLIRGEDYNFEFSAKQEEGQINFRLVMRPDESQRGESMSQSQTQKATKIDFVFNPDEDTADGLAQEMAQQFDLSVTDQEICAAAIKEWLAREMPDQDDQNV